MFVEKWCKLLRNSWVHILGRRGILVGQGFSRIKCSPNGPHELMYAAFFLIFEELCSNIFALDLDEGAVRLNRGKREKFSKILRFQIDLEKNSFGKSKTEKVATLILTISDKWALHV